MGNYPVGRLIAEVRDRRGFSQEELSAGICAVSTLSRIENGVQMPSRRVYMALLQRLGLSHRSCRIFVSSVDMQRSALEEKIECLIGKSRYAQACGMLMEYILCGTVPAGVDQREALLSYARRLGVPEEKVCSEDGYTAVGQILLYLAGNRELLQGNVAGLSSLELQYALFQLGAMLEKGEGNKERALVLFRHAAGLTMPDISPEYLQGVRMFSREELLILCHIAVLRYAKGEEICAKKILFTLRDYMEEPWIDTEEKADSYPKILYYLAIWMGKDKRLDRQLEFCDSGIALCLQNGRLTMLPELLEVKGCALAADRKIQEAEPILKQAYLILQMIGESARAEVLQGKARDLFQIELVTADMN